MKDVFEMLGPQGIGSYEVDWDDMHFTRVDKPADHLLVPGFIDIHTHGAFGVDFMAADAKDMSHWISKMESQGYAGFLPTTVTSSAEAVKRALSVLPEHPMVLGFHLEGPFISHAYPGAQPKEFILDPPEGHSEWDEILTDPRLKVITLAPELPRALEFITQLMKRNVIVSMGHTNATYDEARRGYEFGARHTTHTFNAMKPLHHREAGTVGYALANDDLTCELIYDHVHVCKEAASILVKNKPLKSLIAVSDSTMAAGLPAGTHLKMWNLDCVVGKHDVRLETGALAGSTITLLDAFRNLYDDFGLERAVYATSLNPARALGLGSPEVFIKLDRKLNIIERKVI